jgi:CBS domain-containing protein
MLNKTVKDIMVTGGKVPKVHEGDFFRTAMEIMVTRHKGGVAVVNDADELTGIIVDGDIKRLILDHDDPLPALFVKTAKDLMIENPKSVTADEDVIEVLKVMTQKSIWCMPVVDDKNHVIGFFQMKELLDEFVKEL